MRGWLEALPDELVRVRPVLSIGFVGALLSTGELEGVESAAARRRAVAGRAAGTRCESGSPFGRDGRGRRGGIPPPPGADRAVPRRPGAGSGRCAAAPSARPAGARPRSWTTITSDVARPRRSSGSRPGRAGISRPAHRRTPSRMASLQRAGHIADTLRVRDRPGRHPDRAGSPGRRDAHLRAGVAACAVSRAGRCCAERQTCTSGMSELHRERDDLRAATQHLLRSQELGEHVGLPQNPYRWRVAMARIREAEGDLDGALDLLDEAERVYVGDFFPNVRPIAAMRATGLDRAGSTRRSPRLGARAGPVRRRRPQLPARVRAHHPGQGAPGAAPERARRALRSRGDRGSWSASCERPKRASRTGSVIEILVLQALAYQRQGDIPAALAPLERALTLAEPEGYVRVFVDEGAPMAALLRVAARAAARRTTSAAAGGLRPRPSQTGTRSRRL